MVYSKKARAMRSKSGGSRKRQYGKKPKQQKRSLRRRGKRISSKRRRYRKKQKGGMEGGEQTHKRAQEEEWNPLLHKAGPNGTTTSNVESIRKPGGLFEPVDKSESTYVPPWFKSSKNTNFSSSKHKVKTNSRTNVNASENASSIKISLDDILNNLDVFVKSKSNDPKYKSFNGRKTLKKLLEEIRDKDPLDDDGKNKITNFLAP